MYYKAKIGVTIWSFILAICLPSLLVQARTYILDAVHFDPGSSIVQEKQLNQLKILVETMDNGPHGRKIKTLIINGHADATEENPMKLSQQRADAIYKGMIQMGIDSSRLVVKASGNTLPNADDKTIEGRAKNRRVDFTFELDWDSPAKTK